MPVSSDPPHSSPSYSRQSSSSPELSIAGRSPSPSPSSAAEQQQQPLSPSPSNFHSQSAAATTSTASYPGTSAASRPSSFPRSSSTSTATSPALQFTGNIPEFISKLYTLLQNPLNANIATWTPEGESFIILDINEFSRSVLPQHFKHSNFSSFVRQLNKYDFHKVKNSTATSAAARHFGEEGLAGDLPSDSASSLSGGKGPGSGGQLWEFLHPNFKRDRMDQLCLIRRKRSPDSNATGTRISHSHSHPHIPPANNSSISHGNQSISHGSHTNVPHLLMNLGGSAYRQQPQQLHPRPQYPLAPSPAPPSHNMNPLMALASTTTATADYESSRQQMTGNQYNSYRQHPLKPHPQPSPTDPYYSQRPRPTEQRQGSISVMMEELYAMHDQIGSIAKIQNDMALALQVISRNYQALIDEYCILRRQVSEQGKVQQILLANRQQPHSAPSALASMPEPSYSEKNVESQLQTFNMDHAQSLTPVAQEVSDEDDGCFETANYPSISHQHSFHNQHQHQQQNSLSSTSNAPLNTTPAVLSTPESPPPSASASSVQSNSSFWRIPPKILLVEDDVICRKLSSRILELFNCIVDISPDGNDAVQKVSSNSYDLVLMDIVMPNMDGLSATKRIRTFNTAVPIVSMTSNISQDDCIVYLSTGMNDILAKPFSKESMLSLLEKYCKHLK